MSIELKCVFVGLSWQGHMYVHTPINKTCTCIHILTYRIAGNFGKHNIWQIRFQMVLVRIKTIVTLNYF